MLLINLDWRVSGFPRLGDSRHSQRHVRWLVAWGLAVGLLLLMGCPHSSGSGNTPAAGKEGRSRGSAPVPVEVEELKTEPIEYEVQAVGSVEAFEIVHVTAKVAGTVTKVSFKEGDGVTESTVLTEIDLERYTLAQKAAKADVDKAKAAKDEADAGVSRRTGPNVNRDMVSLEEIETWQHRQSVATAEHKRAEVALEQATLNLRDATVRPLKGGVIETRSVQTGQYVTPGTVLATLVQREPLLLRFAVTEQESAQLKRDMTATLIVDNSRRYVAKLLHVGVAANSTTRMVPVTAHVTDERRGELRPGTFAEIRVTVAVAETLTIPIAAVRPSEKGFLAYTVVQDAGKTVAKECVLTLGMRTADGKVEVTSGLKPGEWVVVRGAEGLRPNAVVAIAGGAKISPPSITRTPTTTAGTGATPTPSNMAANSAAPSNSSSPSGNSNRR